MQQASKKGEGRGDIEEDREWQSDGPRIKGARCTFYLTLFLINCDTWFYVILF